MRILWSSNAPWAATGYGNQSKLFLPRLKGLGHDLAMFAWYGLEGAIINIADGIPVYPKGAHPYGNDIVGAHAAHFKADIVISLIDAWVLDDRVIKEPTKWVPWFPIDMEPIPPPVLTKVSRAFQPIVYSKWALQMARNANLDARYVPHGVDTNVYKPMDKKEARKRLGWPQDGFIVGMVAANKGTPSRKSYPQQLEAFARFKKNHPDALLYLHTTKGENGEMQGVNLPEICRHLEIADSVLFCDQYQNALGFSEEYMATVYSAMSVLLSVSMGEGFGIPILEAQACGTPVIIGDWTAMSELCFGGWKVRKEDADKWWTPLASYQYTPRIEAIKEQLEAVYSCGSCYEQATQQARQGALEYDADRVTREHWKPVLDEIADRMGIAKPTRQVLRAQEREQAKKAKVRA